jgi:hypothetical protein
LPPFADFATAMSLEVALAVSMHQNPFNRNVVELSHTNRLKERRPLIPAMLDAIAAVTPGVLLKVRGNGARDRALFVVIIATRSAYADPPFIVGGVLHSPEQIAQFIRNYAMAQFGNGPPLERKLDHDGFSAHHVISGLRVRHG